MQREPAPEVNLGRATIGTLACVVLLCGHGLNVSPLGARDNVFIDIDPAASYQYDMPIPIDHPVGLFWYHPHFHPYVNTGIAGGFFVYGVHGPR